MNKIPQTRERSKRRFTNIFMHHFILNVKIQTIVDLKSKEKNMDSGTFCCHISISKSIKEEDAGNASLEFKN